jgi:mono/diheme cytochrome c family protein
MKTLAIGLLSAGLLLFPAAAVSKHRSWLDRANADPKTARLTNPYEGQPEEVKAGEKLYHHHCSACHGADATGIRRNPSLHSPTVKNAAPGALYWLLRNCSLARGMPSWSSLPPEQRWQLVTWMKSLESK